ncbi:DinB family protein [Streptomyces sp. AV19]|uniref:DinB family protein n=1 Tax=Streptomyces sp. AV19 TaxID=2793068 RepID=UPI0018FE9AE8|nr:DinB family protein [Streptomyces sp. AV19]MBH1934918.1 DinB family protein [Streptomyces sp. AV19]MDG4537053.1 DinB family protein [Streptomyces sp. AV19]
MPTLVTEKNTGDELGALLGFLDAQRGGVRRAVLGLTEEQAGARPSASAMSLAGLLKHLVQVEHNWVERARGDEPEISREEAVKRFEAGWHPDADETVPVLLARWEEVAAETERFARSVPMERVFALPEAPWFPKDAQVSTRWLLLHLIEETARHAGHADIIRETIDGKTAFELVAEAGA